jgi:hypothetical protein
MLSSFRYVQANEALPPQERGPAETVAERSFARRQLRAFPFLACGVLSGSAGQPASRKMRLRGLVVQTAWRWYPSLYAPRQLRAWASLSTAPVSNTGSAEHVALVTGSSRGLGLEFTRQLLQRPNQRCRRSLALNVSVCKCMAMLMFGIGSALFHHMHHFHPSYTCIIGEHAPHTMSWCIWSAFGELYCVQVKASCSLHFPPCGWQCGSNVSGPQPRNRAAAAAR